MEYIDRRKNQVQRAVREEREQEHWNEVHEQLLAIQKKSLEVSDPNDADEKEADEVARKVMGGESAEIHGTGGTINRKGEGATETTPAFQSQLESSKGGGQSLDDSTKSEMESKMGADLSGVKIHTNGEANKMNESVNAKAFTHGQDIYFGSNNSPQDKELLAHELVHTVQQGKDVNRRIQPQLKIQRKPKVSFIGVQIYKIDFSDLLFKNLMGSAYDDIKGSSYYSIKAENIWWLNFAQSQTFDTEEKKSEELNKLVIGNADIKLKLDKHFTEVALSGIKDEYKFNDPQDSEIPFKVTGSLDALKLTLGGKDTTLDLLSFKVSAKYEINKENLGKPGFEFITSILEQLPVVYDKIASGECVLSGEFKITFSISLKSLTQYLKDKKLAKDKGKEKSEHEKKETEKRTTAQDATEKKNQLKAEADKLNTELQQKENELKRLKKNPNPTLAEQEKISRLEKEVTEGRTTYNELREAESAERTAMQEANNAANAEKKAAQKASRELAQAEKNVAKYETKFKDRVKNISKKFREGLEKIEERIIQKTTRYVEEKLVKWVGKKIATQILKVVAYAIPILGEILMIIDVALLIWDIAELIWEYRKEIWNWMKETAKEIAETIVKVAEKVLDYLIHPMKLLKDIVDGFKKLWESIKDLFSKKKGGDTSFTPSSGTPGNTTTGDPGSTGTGTTTTGTETTTTTPGTTTTGTGTTTTGTETTTTTPGTTTTGTGTTTTGTETTTTTPGTTTTGTTTTTTSGTGNPNPADTVTTTTSTPTVTTPVTNTNQTTSTQTTSGTGVNNTQKGEQEIFENGKVLPYQAPSESRNLDLRWHGAKGLTTTKLNSGDPYEFILIIHYRDNGINRVAQSSSPQSFVFDHYDKEKNRYVFKVGDAGFNVKTDVTTICYSPGFVVKVKLE